MRCRRLGLVDYTHCWQAMQAFTDTRGAGTEDELWLLQHPPVFTQGQAGRAEHLLRPGDIPVVQSDRGGQVTYHGPGQWIVYLLIDLRRMGLGVRRLVSLIEASVVELLAGYGIAAQPRPDAPGVYVAGAKIASLGLRVRRGCSLHGVALNVDMDLAPFARIDPCGYPGLAVTSMARCLGGAAGLVEEAGARAAGSLGEVGARAAGSLGEVGARASCPRKLVEEDVGEQLLAQIERHLQQHPGAQ